MKISRISLLSFRTHEREIDITEEQLSRWTNGELIQNVCPHLSADDREFLISGITPEEWEDVFGKEVGEEE